MEELIRRILTENGKLGVDAGSVDLHEDLYECGLTSHACVNVMLALEDELDFEFPDRLLRMSTFQSVHNISEALRQVGVTVRS